MSLTNYEEQGHIKSKKPEKIREIRLTTQRRQARKDCFDRFFPRGGGGMK
jgi:hypothetical protein